MGWGGQRIVHHLPTMAGRKPRATPGRAHNTPVSPENVPGHPGQPPQREGKGRARTAPQKWPGPSQVLLGGGEATATNTTAMDGTTGGGVSMLPGQGMGDAAAPQAARGGRGEPSSHSHILLPRAALGWLPAWGVDTRPCGPSKSLVGEALQPIGVGNLWERNRGNA